MRGRARSAAAFILCACVRIAADDAEALVEGLSLFGRPSVITVRIDMALLLKNGRKERSLDVFIRRDDRRVSALVEVVSPAFLSSMKLLSVRETGGEDSSWLKTSHGVRRLTDATSSERVFDSDFTADDFMVISGKRFDLSMLPDSVLEGVRCRTVEARPRYAAGYARRLLYIGEADGDLRGADFLAADGSMLRRYRLLATQMVGGRSYPLTSRMEDLRGGTSSMLTVVRLDTETPLPDRLFARGNL